jgi:hypothetical protein
VIGAWRNFQGGGQPQEGVVVQTNNAEQSGAIVDQTKAEVTPYMAQTALSTPLNPDGTYESVYGPGHQILTQEDIDLGLAEDGYAGVPTQTSERNTAIVVDYTETENPDGTVSLVPADYNEVADSDEPPADAAEYGRIDDVPVEAETTERIESAPGPLAEVDGHVWTELDQAGAARWHGKIVQRVGEVARQHFEWEAPDEDMLQQFGQKIANELMLDYADLLRMRVEQDRVERQQTLAQLRAEHGPDLTPLLEGVEHGLRQIPDGLGVLIIEARTRDGRRLINVPGIASWITRGAAQAGDYIEAETIDESSEREQILNLMREDMRAYREDRLWGANRDKTGDKRLYEIDKKRERRAA